MMTSGSNTPSSTPPVLVTGSAGHVGANLVHRLLDDGVRVWVLLRHEDNNEALDGLDVERAFADIRDLNATRHALAGCHGVYHVDRGEQTQHGMNEVQIPVSVVARADADTCKDRNNQRRNQSYRHHQVGVVCVPFGNRWIFSVFGRVS